MIASGASADPHVGGSVAWGGAPLARARLAVVMLHGRGGSARDMLDLAEHFAIPDIAYLAPEAAGHSWWPQSFLAPLAANEPGLSTSLRAVARLMEQLKGEGFGPERTVALGFSQGACLALEYAARAGRPLRAVVGLSGGLIGTGEVDGPRATISTATRRSASTTRAGSTAPPASSAATNATRTSRSPAYGKPKPC